MPSAFLTELIKTKKAKKKGENTNPLTDEQKKYAYLSDVAYKTGGNRSREVYLRKTVGDEYKIDRELSNKNHSVIHDGNKTYVSFRGTANASDIATDAALAFGAENKTKRFRDSQNLLDSVIKKYGRENLVLTGHSLGGSIASTLGRKNDIEAHVFNPGSSINSVRSELSKQILGDDRTTKVYNYSTGSDPISWLARGSSGNDEFIYVPPSGLNTHGLSNFLN